jgi:hypothetical protein
MYKSFICEQQTKHLSLRSSKPEISPGIEDKFNKSIESIRSKAKNSNTDEKKYLDDDKKCRHDEKKYRNDNKKCRDDDKKCSDDENHLKDQTDTVTILPNETGLPIKSRQDQSNANNGDAGESESITINTTERIVSLKEGSKHKKFDDNETYETIKNCNLGMPFNDISIVDNVTQCTHVNCTSFDDIFKKFNDVLLSSKQTDDSKWEFSYIDHSSHQIELMVKKISPSNLTITVNSAMPNYSMAKIIEELNTRLSTKGWKSRISKQDESDLHVQAMHSDKNYT